MNGIIGFILAFFHVSPVIETRGVINPEDTWSCKPAEWVEKAQVSDGAFTGAIQALCTFQTGGNKGLGGLKSYLIEKTEKSKKVYSGPKNEVYEKIDSLFYDVTQEIIFGETNVELRADVHIARDEEKLVHYDVFSTSINATGQAALLKKFDVQTSVQPTDKEKIYQLTLHIKPKVKKPAFVPGGMFRDELKKQIEKMAPGVEKGVIEEIQPYI